MRCGFSVGWVCVEGISSSGSESDRTAKRFEVLIGVGSMLVPGVVLRFLFGGGADWKSCGISCGSVIVVVGVDGREDIEESLEPWAALFAERRSLHSPYTGLTTSQRRLEPHSTIHNFRLMLYIYLYMYDTEIYGIYSHVTH